VHDASTGPGHRTVPPSLPPRVPVPVGGAAARLPLVGLGARPPSELTSSKGSEGGAATTVVGASYHAAAACGAATVVAVAGGGAPSSFPIGAADIFGSRHRPWPVSVGTLYALFRTADHSGWRPGWRATPHSASARRTRASGVPRAVFYTPEPPREGEEQAKWRGGVEQEQPEEQNGPESGSRGPTPPGPPSSAAQ